MNEKDYQITEVMQEVIADESWGESPENRAEIIYGLINALFS